MNAGSQKKKRGPKFTPTEREAMIAEVCRLDTEGRTQWEIAHTLKISQPQVYQYLRAARIKYNESTVANRTEKIEEAERKINLIYSKALDAWEKSHKKVVSVVVKEEVEVGKNKDGTSKMETKEVVKRVTLPKDPDNDYLVTALDAIKSWKELFGLDEPKRVDMTQKVSVVEWDKVIESVPSDPKMIENAVEREIAKALAEGTVIVGTSVPSEDSKEE